MEENKDTRIPLHVSTIDLGPHQERKIHLPHVTKHEGKHSTFIWVLATIIIGISVVYFLFDVSRGVVTFVKNFNEPNKIEQIIAKDENQEDRYLGSDDNQTEEAKAPLLSQSTTTPVLGTYYFNTENYVLPRTNALSYLVADVDTGEVIIEKNSSTVFPIASVTKFLTATVAKENIDLHKEITVSRSSVEAYGTAGGLYVGEKILFTDLLYPLLIESSNDAAEVIAEGYGREEFMKKLNEKAKSLGMKNSYFKDPSGLSHENVSTAEDLFKLGQHIYHERSELLDITRVRQYAIRNHSWSNGNRFLPKSTFIGGKNGFTDAAFQTTLSLFELPVEGYKRRIAIILLKSNDRTGDADSIIRFIGKFVGFNTDSSLNLDN